MQITDARAHTHTHRAIGSEKKKEREIKRRVNEARNHPLSVTHKSHLPAETRGSAIFSPYLLTQQGEERPWGASSFSRSKGRDECLEFRGGWRGWNLSPRGQTAGFFSFQAFIDSPLSSSATQEDTWKNFWWGCDVRKRGDLLCLTHSPDS